MTPPEVDRFRDTGENISAFIGETLVVCPQCSGRALSRQVEGDDSLPGWLLPRRLTCTGCSFAKNWASNKTINGSYRICDDYFELPLWLQTPCCGEVLWAYNERHIEFLEAFVGARLRERVRHDEYGWSNRSVVSRLPSWIKAAKNRDEVLEGLSRLRTRLQEAR